MPIAAPGRAADRVEPEWTKASGEACSYGGYAARRPVFAFTTHFRPVPESSRRLRRWKNGLRRKA